MTISDPRFDPVVVAAPSPAHARHTQVLASALAHLLGREGELPARWGTSAFSHAVEAARGRLHPVGTLAELDRAASQERSTSTSTRRHAGSAAIRGTSRWRSGAWS